MKDAVYAIIGELRGVPIFSNVEGNGNRAIYDVVKFAGARIMDARLNGSPPHRRIVVQPSPLSDSTIVSGSDPITIDGLLSSPRLLK